MLTPQIPSHLDWLPQRHLFWTKNIPSSFSFHSGQQESFRSGYKLIWKVIASTLSLGELFLHAAGRQEASFFQAKCQAGSRNPLGLVGQSRQEQIGDNNGKRNKPVGKHKGMIRASILSLHSQPASEVAVGGVWTIWAPLTSFCCWKSKPKYGAFFLPGKYQDFQDARGCSDWNFPWNVFRFWKEMDNRNKFGFWFPSSGPLSFVMLDVGGEGVLLNCRLRKCNFLPENNGASLF